TELRVRCQGRKSEGAKRAKRRRCEGANGRPGGHHVRSTRHSSSPRVSPPRVAPSLFVPTTQHSALSTQHFLLRVDCSNCRVVSQSTPRRTARCNSYRKTSFFGQAHLFWPGCSLVWALQSPKQSRPLVAVYQSELK